MADDLNKPYEYPFELPAEEEIRFKDAGAVEGRQGVPSSYDEGDQRAGHLKQFQKCTRSPSWRYQVRGYNTTNVCRPLTT